jgi:hypothetical protein
MKAVMMASLPPPSMMTTATLALALALPLMRIGWQGGGWAMTLLIRRSHGHCCWRHPWLGIPIFGYDLWDSHRKWNFDSVSDSGDSSQNFYLNSAVEKLTNQNYVSKIRNSERKIT